MGKTFENLTCEEMCDLMCGLSDDEIIARQEEAERRIRNMQKKSEKPKYKNVKKNSKSC